jgi:PKHD-type hydroxylase
MEPYLMTSRKGIYLNFTKKLIDGKFFGLTHQGPVWYAFGTHADDIHAPSFQGYILQFEIDSNGEMTNQKEVFTGLDNGVHQMCIWKDHLYVLETYVQRISVIDLKDFTKSEIYPFDRAISAWYQQNGLEGSCEKYVHMNAITVQDDRFYVMCPHLKNDIINGIPSQERNPSHIVMFGPDWKVLDTFDTGRYFCHDLVIIGHEIHFADATNTICKLNIVTRQVEQVWTVNPVSPDLRKICRGLSICENGQVWVGSHDLENKHSYAVDFIKKQHIEVSDMPCCIKRLDGTDFNDETSHLKRSFTLTYPSSFNSITNSIYNKLLNVHKNNEKPACKFDYIRDFLNPDFSKFKNETQNTTCVPITNLEKTMPLPYYLIESGPFYLYPENSIMDWHTNNTQLKEDNFLLKYRMYTVNTIGNSYFMYKHPISNKIHAIKDINGTCLVFNLGPEFWHAVICTKGSRLSYGVKFAEEALDIMGIDNIWKSPKNTFKLVFPLSTNDNVVKILQINDFMNENEINKLRSQCQNLHFTDGTLGSDNTLSNYRRSKLCFITKTWEFTEIYLKIFNFIYKINKDTFNYNLNELEELQYTEYDESYQGHYDWHIDIGKDVTSTRKLSIVIQLSDPTEYEGCELQINTGGHILSCNKSKGTIIVFPSFLVHKVTPVTKGTRRSLVTWVTGPPFV